MENLIKEGAEVIKEDAEPATKDAALIAAAQKVEHYEIAGYGCVRTYAELMGHQKAARVLQKTLDEEGATDKSLTQLAMKINVKAENEPMQSNGAAKSSGAAKKKGRSNPLGKRILEAAGL
jgi:ferritin-like metal-binding protein YciE